MCSDETLPQTFTKCKPLYYDHIELTETEIIAAIREAKIKKYFAQKNAEYWKDIENKKA